MTRFAAPLRVECRDYDPIDVLPIHEVVRRQAAFLYPSSAGVCFVRADIRREYPAAELSDVVPLESYLVAKHDGLGAEPFSSVSDISDQGDHVRDRVLEIDGTKANAADHGVVGDSANRIVEGILALDALLAKLHELLAGKLASRQTKVSVLAAQVGKHLKECLVDLIGLGQAQIEAVSHLPHQFFAKLADLLVHNENFAHDCPGFVRGVAVGKSQQVHPIRIIAGADGFDFVDDRHWVAFHGRNVSLFARPVNRPDESRNCA